MIQLGRLIVVLGSVGQKTPILPVATDKETNILAAINVQGKKLHTLKTCNIYLVVSLHTVDWLHVLEGLVGGNEYRKKQFRASESILRY